MTGNEAKHIRTEYAKSMKKWLENKELGTYSPNEVREVVLAYLNDPRHL